MELGRDKTVGQIISRLTAENANGGAVKVAGTWGSFAPLLVKHISDNNKEGSRFRDLRQVLPSLSIGQLKALMKELKEEGRIYSKGKTKAGLWHLSPKDDQLDEE